jgi:hypothetical protein
MGRGPTLASEATTLAPEVNAAVHDPSPKVAAEPALPPDPVSKDLDSFRWEPLPQELLELK